MSLVLEALRKSEAERRRGQVPGLHAELPPAPAQRRAATTAWMWLLPAGAIVFAALWLVRAPRPSNAPAAATVNAAITADPIDPTPALPPVPRLEPAPPSARRGPAPAPVIASANAQPQAHPSQAAASPAPPVSAMRAPPPPAIAPPPATSGALQLSDLTAEERKSLPPLKLSMHLWNDDPQQRFVILDGNRLREGDRLGNAVVTAITSDGVLLDWNGRQLKLSIH
jgi:general secretion pathway protein B